MLFLIHKSLAPSPQGIHGLIMAEDFFSRKLYQAKDSLIIVEEGKKNLDFSKRRQMNKTVNVSVKLAPSWLQQAAIAYQLREPRGQCFFFWSSASLYKILGLTCYMSSPSKWFYEMADGWGKWFETCGFKKVHIMHGRLSYKKEQVQGTHSDAILPTPSLSTVGLLLVLTRLACLSPRRGGLRDPTAQSAAKWFVVSLIRGTDLGPGDMASIHLRLANDWEHIWPCREHRSPDISLPLDRDGNVNLDSLRVESERSQTKEAPDTCRFICTFACNPAV